jgi:hypothetical protein
MSNILPFSNSLQKRLGKNFKNQKKGNKFLIIKKLKNNQVAFYMFLYVQNQLTNFIMVWKNSLSPEATKTVPKPM